MDESYCHVIQTHGNYETALESLNYYSFLMSIVWLKTNIE